MAAPKIKQFPKSRIATQDISTIGLRKHHVVALLEIDVTECRRNIRMLKKNQLQISFTAWMIKAIAASIQQNEQVAAYLAGKRALAIFNEVRVSLLVEKELHGQKVPFPLLIHHAETLPVESIHQQIQEARRHSLTENDIVLSKKSNRMERLYYHLPGFLRRYFWQYLLQHPKIAFSKMGNVSVTSLGMISKASGWFIPIAVHPICFGIGKITKKPVVKHDDIVIREILHMTVLLDHDVVDGAEMARFINLLVSNIEKGTGL